MLLKILCSCQCSQVCEIHHKDEDQVVVVTELAIAKEGESRSKWVSLSIRSLSNRVAYKSPVSGN